MEGRLSFDEMLRERLGNKVNYYFQPPNNLLLKYPALVYKLDGIHHRHANDGVYTRKHVYHMVLITDNPDNDLADRIDDLPYCRMAGNSYTTDNLYHYPFTIYY